MISYLVDQIPLWVYIVAVVGAVGALFYFFSPILVPIWNITPTWVKELLFATLAVGAAFIAGRNKGNADAKKVQEKENKEAVANRETVDESVNKLPSDAATRRLDGWMRDGK